MLYKYFVLYWLSIFSIASFGQSLDSIVPISTIIVQGERLIDFGLGSKIKSIDSTTLSQFSTNNLSDLLQQQGNIFLKTYGLGSLSTPSFRGTGSGHTAILWNGINLQSPMNGVLDFSLVPLSTINSVDIQHGGNSALFGSGAIGGVVHLNTKLALKSIQQIILNSQLGSFGQFQQQGTIKYSNENWANQTNFYYHQANNDFPFLNIAKINTPTENQVNNELNTIGFTQQNTVKLSNTSQLHFNFWYQKTNRQIPPTMTQSESLANQVDELYRMVLNWKKVDSNTIWLARSAFLDETILFNDPVINLAAKNRSKGWINEVETKVYLPKNQLLNVGINYTHYQAETDNYADILHQNRIALFAAYRLSFQKWTTVLSLREEWIDGDFVPLTASLGIEGKLSSDLKVLFNASNNYKIPTFNDLYWVPGGNPDLKPETSWNQDIGLQWSKIFQKTEANLQINLFNSWVDDWILWSPSASSIWTPDNVKKVWARGIEIEANTTFQTASINWNLGLNYSYTKSTNQEIYNNQTTTLNKQLIYTPLHRGGVFVQAVYKKVQFNYHQTIEGERFTSRDNLNSLLIYTVGNITFQYPFQYKNFQFQTQLNIHNIWNTNYQAIQWRPMPLRYFSLGIQLVVDR